MDNNQFGQDWIYMGGKKTDEHMVWVGITRYLVAEKMVLSPQLSLLGLLWVSMTLLLRIARGELRPESELTSNCINFPLHNFNRAMSITGLFGESPHLLLQPGDDAVDFTLHDLNGMPWRLSTALEEGLPVVMIWGMFTCPVYQGEGTDPQFERGAYWDEFHLVSVIQLMQCRNDSFSYMFIFVVCAAYNSATWLKTLRQLPGASRSQPAISRSPIPRVLVE